MTMTPDLAVVGIIGSVRQSGVARRRDTDMKSRKGRREHAAVPAAAELTFLQGRFGGKRPDLAGVTEGTPAGSAKTPVCGGSLGNPWLAFFRRSIFNADSLRSSNAPRALAGVGASMASSTGVAATLASLNGKLLGTMVCRSAERTLRESRRPWTGTPRGALEQAGPGCYPSGSVFPDAVHRLFRGAIAPGLGG